MKQRQATRHRWRPECNHRKHAAGWWEEKDAVRANILKLLEGKIWFWRGWFCICGNRGRTCRKARDYSLDRRVWWWSETPMIICAYTSMMAQLETESVKRTAVTLLVDGKRSEASDCYRSAFRFFENTVAELWIVLVSTASWMCVVHWKIQMLSSDVLLHLIGNAAVNEEKNSAFMGHGLVFNKYRLRDKG